MGLNISFPLYRVAHLVADLGWVDLDFECSTVCPIMSGLMGIWQKGLSKWAKWWKAEIQVNPTQIRDQMGHPVWPFLFCHPQLKCMLHVNKGNQGAAIPHRKCRSAQSSETEREKQRT